jgi:DNA-binding transcriptional MocR family regulator
MKLHSPWKPRLGSGTEVASVRLAAALAEDIASGLLRPGDRLPAHRALSWELKISVTTVTKAYGALERRGLVRSVHGRGSFVADAHSVPRTIVDLSVNAPPQMISDRLMSTTLATVARRLEGGSFSTYGPPSGQPEHRRLLAGLLAARGMATREDRVFMTNGAQQALSIAMTIACSAGATLFTEAVTYTGALLLARQLGLPNVGVAMDTEGLQPDLLARALADHPSDRHVVYLTPTLQNPTTATMGAERRRRIVEVCEKHDALMIEDDVYGVFAPEHQPLASLAPDRTLHVSGLSKTLSPGLRVGILAVPPWAAHSAAIQSQMSQTMVSPLSAHVMDIWLTDGTAERIAQSIRSEAASRSRLAQRIFLPIRPITAADGFHVWLPMPTVEAEEFVLRAAGMGVILMSARAPMTDPALPDGGVRISLGGPGLVLLEKTLTVLSKLPPQANGRNTAGGSRP